MADILIRGVRMPIKDFHITLTIMGTGEVFWFDEKVGTAVPLPEGHGRLMPEWISVNDRLPGEERKDYLCYAKGGYLLICFWTDDIFGLGRWSGEWGWSLLTAPKYDEITHWMPLPEPPKEGGGEDG